MIPVVTLRRYDCTKEHAKQNMEVLRSDISKCGLHDNVHSEYSVYDSNVYMDQVRDLPSYN